MDRQARSGNAVRPIAHLSLVDRVTDELYRAIFNGDILPGSTVTIVELCEQFDVSHIPVREALRRLESEGLVNLRRGRSALVASLSVEDLTDIYRLRKLIEGDLVIRATPEMTSEQLERAGIALDEYLEVEHEPAALTAAHHAFHRVLLEGVLAAADERVLSLLWHAADRYLHILTGDLDRAPEPADEHRHLLGLAQAGKAEELRDAWVAHLDSSEAQLRAALA